MKLPECVINEVPVVMDDKEIAVYDRFREDMVTKIRDKEIDAANAAVLSPTILFTDGLAFKRLLNLFA